MLIQNKWRKKTEREPANQGSLENGQELGM